LFTGKGILQEGEGICCSVQARTGLLAQEGEGISCCLQARTGIAQEGQGILFTGIRELFDRAQQG